MKKKLVFIDAKKAHLNFNRDEDVCIEMPPEAMGVPNQCEKLNLWLNGFRPAAQA